MHVIIHFQQLINRVTVFNGIVQDCLGQQDAPVEVIYFHG